jgi:dienelactone hydrolase
MTTEELAPGVTIVRNVTSWALTRHGDGADAVIVAPGGAFHFLSIEHEGHEVARRLVASLGVTAYVLEYRTLTTPADAEGFRAALARIYTEGIDAVMAPAIPAACEDGIAAVADVRTRHDRVALLGFSAGARLALEALWHGAALDAIALVYPPPVVVPAGATPVPAFTLMAADDPLTTAGAQAVHDAWRAGGASSELHLFAEGGHGFGTNPTGKPVDRWLDLLTDWLGAQGFGSAA